MLVAPLYGQAQILLSRDDGKTFEPRVAPMALVDLAADPGDSKRWAATSESGIFVSVDEGKTWRQRDPTPNVRLAWHESGELFRIDPGGPVKVSTDGGETWQDRGSTGGEPQALAVDDGGRPVRRDASTARSRSPRTAASPGRRSSRRRRQRPSFE